MSLSGLLLGVINIFIVVAILLLVGALVEWFLGWMGIAMSAQIIHRHRRVDCSLHVGGARLGSPDSAHHPWIKRRTVSPPRPNSPLGPRKRSLFLLT
jgi:hypothetical protein